MRPRPPTDPLLCGQLEFPGGRVAPEEIPVECARRELWEETAIRHPDLRFLCRVHHAYADRNLRLSFFLGEIEPPAPKAPPPWRWVSILDVARGPFPHANQEVIARLVRDARGEPST